MLSRARWRDYALLMRLDKPVGIGLLLWPTLWALWLAGRGWPDARVVAIFVLGVIVMRSAGCVINDYADRDFDPHVARTRARPIAAGRVSPQEALALFALLCLLAFGLVLATNPLTVALAVPGVMLAASYPFMKRWTYLPQAYLGLAFSWGIPMAFAAQTGSVAPVAWWLFAANLLWAVAYDTYYALVDIADDRRIGVKSSAILFGRAAGSITAALQLAVLGCLAAGGAQAGLGPPFYIGLFVAAAVAAYQQWLARGLDPARCFKAFRVSNLFGAAVFVGIVASLLQGPQPWWRGVGFDP